MKLQSAAPLLTFGLAANACLLPGEHDGTYKRDTTRRQSGFQDFPIGTGDRFNDGQYAPHGLGTDDRDLGSILNVGEVESGLKGLANAFPDVRLFAAPHETFENRVVYGATVGAAPRVLIQSGVHARERGGPDNVLYLMADLLRARANGTGVAYGNRTYTNAQVQTALSAGVVFVPLANPDGVAYDQQTDSCWRKNRNVTSTAGVVGGVDLNRNFPVMWDYHRIFNAHANLAAAASDDPRSEVFHGTSPFSEAETRNVAWVMAQQPQLSWFLDVHSFGGDVLYAWGDDDTQTTDPQQSFTNPAYDGKRGFVGVDPTDSQYREYIEQADLDAQTALSSRMSGAMNGAGSVRYSPEPSSHLYPTAGSGTDYALGQYYGRNCGANRVQGLTIEFGEGTGSANCPFYPDADRYHESVRQVSAGLMELLLTAAGADGQTKVYKC